MLGRVAARAATDTSLQASVSIPINRLTVAIALIIALTPQMGKAQSQAELLRSTIRSAFADYEFKHFEFYSPVRSRWGLGTMFEKNLNKTKEHGAFIGDPDTWWAPGISEDEKSKILNSMFIEGELGIVKIVNPISTSVDVQASLPIPFLKKLINIKGDVSATKNSTVTITAISAEERELYLPALFNAAKLGKLAPAIVDRIEKADYEIVTKDVVFFGFEATVTDSAQKRVSLSIEAGPSNSDKASGSVQTSTGTSPPGAPKTDETSPKDGTSKDDGGQLPAAAPQAGTLQVKGAADVPMVAAVYVAQATRVPPAGALTNPKEVPSQIDAGAFRSLVDSLEETLGPPKGVTVVQKAVEH
jgi:hypothetical protein